MPDLLYWSLGCRIYCIGHLDAGSIVLVTWMPDLCYSCVYKHTCIQVYSMCSMMESPTSQRSWPLTCRDLNSSITCSIIVISWHRVVYNSVPRFILSDTIESSLLLSTSNCSRIGFDNCTGVNHVIIIETLLFVHHCDLTVCTSLWP